MNTPPCNGCLYRDGSCSCQPPVDIYVGDPPSDIFGYKGPSYTSSDDGEAVRIFRLIRDEDESGVSGTGHVADGVQFHNGKCAVSWRTPHTSVSVYDDIETVEAIHGHGGKTRIEWVSSQPKLL